MYRTGDYVVYGENGVCRVENVGTPAFEPPTEGRRYYFLRASEYDGMIYAPTDSPVPIRPLVSPQEARQLLQDLPGMAASLPCARDRKAVTQHYQQLLRAHTFASLALTVKSLYHRQAGPAAKLSATEENILKKTERVLCAELAAALDTTPEEAKAAFHAAMNAPQAPPDAQRDDG